MAEGTPEGAPETGSSLREKLEAALAAVASLTSENVSYKAKDLISAKGYTHVTPEQLAGVKPEELEAKAAELEQEGSATELAVLTRVLTAKGLSSEDLESTIKGLTGTTPAEQASEALSRIRAATQIPGTPLPRTDEVPRDLTGPDLLRHAFKT